MNWIDKAILWANPEAGRRRIAHRRAAEALLSYDGARSDRRQGGFRATSSSGNAETGASMVRLRNNARELYRNNAYAKRAVREWAKRVVGTGITPRPDTGSDSLNKLIRGYIDQWSPRCMSDQRIPFAAAEKLIVASAFLSGEVLIRQWDRRLEDGLPIPFQFQVIESDYLDSSKTQTLESGYIIQGVQFDSIGRIQGYWLFGSHPGDPLTTSARGLTSKFIPARDVLHHAEIERPGDVRAVTRFAAVMAKLQDIDEYADAYIVKAKSEACLVGVVTQPEGPDGPTLGGVAVDANGNKIESMQPGMMAYTPPGADVKFLSPTGSGDFSAHKETELREVAVGLDIPYILLDDNLRAVNYSSYRGGLLAYRDAIDEYRWNWLIPQVLDPLYTRIIDALYMAGKIPEPNYQHQWDPPPFELLDRAAEAEADRAELQIGKKSWPQLVGAQGNDPEQQIGEIETWKPRLEKAGITYAKSTSESSTDGGNDGKAQPQQ